MRGGVSRVTYLLVAAMAGLLAGCPYSSEVPLSPVEGARIDEDLVGRWLLKRADPGPSGSMTFIPFNEHEFVVVFQEQGADEPDLARAFVSLVGGEKFLNVQSVRTATGPRRWEFLQYVVADGKLTYRVVDDRLFPRGDDKVYPAIRSSSEAFSEFVRAHLRKDDLYDKEVTTLTKEK